MPANLLKQWEREFRKAAKADNLTLFSDHLKRLGLPDEPELILKGTINLVIACCAYLEVDGESIAEFLDTQKYKPAEAPGAKYALTFHLCGDVYGRLLASGKKPLKNIDLADLYGHPWYEYKMCGYYTIWISRVDGRDLTKAEIERFDQAVSDDLRFDYSEEELGVDFDPDSIEGVLTVTVQDVL